MNFTIKRLTNEIKKYNKDVETNMVPYGIEIYPKENILEWTAYITGGKDTPHENLKYEMCIRIDNDYPRKPPQIFFVSKIFHPNVYRDGKICIDILQGQWSPTLKIVSALVSIQSMLDDPNPFSPANSEAASLYKKSKEEYKKQIILTYNKNTIKL